MHILKIAVYHRSWGMGEAVNTALDCKGGGENLPRLQTQEKTLIHPPRAQTNLNSEDFLVFTFDRTNSVVRIKLNKLFQCKTFFARSLRARSYFWIRYIFGIKLDKLLMTR